MLDVTLLKLLSLSALSGAMLFVSDYPLRLWWLQCIAFIPLIAGLLLLNPTVVQSMIAGGALALFYVLPLLIILRLPLALSVSLGLYLALLWIFCVMSTAMVLKLPAPFNALAAGCLIVLFEWMNSTLFPMWGTAQSFTRVWSACPPAIQFVSVTGMTGIAFMLLTTQTLIVLIALRPDVRLVSFNVLASLLLLVSIYNYTSWTRKPAGFIRVAAMGWTARDIADSNGMIDQLELVNKTYRGMVEKAAAAGARLVVSPEAAFEFGADRDKWIEIFSAIARRHRVMLAVGYFDATRNMNRVMFIDAEGVNRGEYAKSHLIPLMEGYQAGDGSICNVPLDDLRVGTMICQDDNFTDIARAYGRQMTQVMAVPTRDWRRVKDYHFENSIFRGIENRYGIARAASDGISAIVSPRGDVLASKDHFEEGPAYVIAQVPVFNETSFYARNGEWLAAVCATLLIVAFVLHRYGSV